MEDVDKFSGRNIHPDRVMTQWVLVLMTSGERSFRIYGEDHVALGADLDGMDSKLEGSGYGCYGPVARKLEEIFSPRVAEKICYKNALRVLKDCL